MVQRKIKVAVIGDIHDQWNSLDHQILKFLEVDLVLLVGDFGNESLEVVGHVARLEIPKAVVLGNHDAWYSATKWGRKKSPYDHNKEDRVQQQLDLLGCSHVGYGRLDFAHLGLSVVGSRPFSWGGSKWKCEDFYAQRYGVSSFDDSSQRIFEQCKQTTQSNVIFVGHNGPFGLGANPEDTCGKDWNPIGGDFGDPDFQGAIALSRQLDKTISLVTFGHMHHRLRHTKARLRTIINRDQHNTIYLNAASTPRIQEKQGIKAHNYSIVTYENNQITDISLLWVNQNLEIVSTTPLYSPTKIH
ncbi:TIGR04168 family protein [Cyanobacterium stanieri LEGE 03274]|uniref:TIGR04168 family protein n=1 Tax=Cyanobacterium stanieri LEGE 03274 TaxID=1828756 RepID=A0ABR9V443_9CHRO|nr:TIGR04168 family protein [Cyanobacterium stanieri]MBE9222648.1 TIGR04168 family protein [Cyanobacterium stanieri LEGE 03274]